MTSPFGQLLVELGVITDAQLAEACAKSSEHVGETLLALGHVTLQQLQDALAAVSPTRPRLGEVLTGLAHITQDRLDAVLPLQATDGRPLGELLVERGDCTYEQIYEALRVQSSGTARRVLVVDDSEMVCDLLKEGLSSHGFEVTAIQDPTLALESIEHSRPDIVVSDLNMPEMDGAELCRRLKAHSSDLPVIILTANEQEEAVVGLHAGADDYLRKNTSMPELAARIDAITRRTTATSRVRKAFARYTSEAVVEKVLEAGDIAPVAEKRDVSVLFADIRNFTSFAERLSPERVMATLNDVLGLLADAVLAHGGTVDKFLGDGLMAVFGAPRKRDDHPQLALAAAHQMLDVTQARNRRCGDDLVLEVGVAINTGPAIVGPVGNERRTEYTCIGDTVNVASRLCSLAAPGEILVGEGLVHRIGVPAAFSAMPEVLLKGKVQTIPLFRANRPGGERS